MVCVRENGRSEERFCPKERKKMSGKKKETEENSGRTDCHVEGWDYRRKG